MVAGGVLRELRDPFLHALALRDTHDREDDVDERLEVTGPLYPRIGYTRDDRRLAGVFLTTFSAQDCDDNIETTERSAVSDTKADCRKE